MLLGNKIMNKHELCCNPIIIYEHVRKLIRFELFQGSRGKKIFPFFPVGPMINHGLYHCRVNRPAFQHYPPTTMSTYSKVKMHVVHMYMCS